MSVKQYDVALASCCLISSDVDPRSGFTSGQPGAFVEEECFEYFIDIQAQVGLQMIDDGTGVRVDDKVTGQSAEGDFWGWLTTSVDHGRHDAVHSQLTYTTDRGFAVELLGAEERRWPDADGNGIADVCDCTITEAFGDIEPDSDVDMGDIAMFQQCFTGKDIPSATSACLKFDGDCDEDIDSLDYLNLNILMSGP